MTLTKFPIAKDIPFSSYSTPAARACAAFGSANALAKLLGMHRTSVLRWTYEKPNGTGGHVPAEHQSKILKLAKERGIKLKPEHLVGSA